MADCVPFLCVYLGPPTVGGMLTSSDVVVSSWCSKCGALHDDVDCKVYPLARVHHPDAIRAVGYSSSASLRPLPASAVTIRSSVCLSIYLLFCSSVSLCLALRACGARGEKPLRWRARSGDARSLALVLSLSCLVLSLSCPVLSLSCPCRTHHDLLTRCASRCALGVSPKTATASSIPSPGIRMASFLMLTMLVLASSRPRRRGMIVHLCIRWAHQLIQHQLTWCCQCQRTVPLLNNGLMTCARMAPGATLRALGLHQRC